VDFWGRFRGAAGMFGTGMIRIGGGWRTLLTLQSSSLVRRVGETAALHVLVNDLLLQSLLGGGQVGCRLLRRWRDLHPIVLPPLHRDPVLCRLLHKLVLEGFKAVETNRGHVAVLHRDRPLGRLVLSQEREVLQHDMQLKRTRLWWRIPFGPCFLDSKNVSREFPKCIQEIRAASRVFGLGPASSGYHSCGCHCVSR